MATAARKPKKAALKKAAKKTAVKKSAPAKRNMSNPLRRSCGVRELRQSASQVLDIVKSGVAVEITEHGVPVARLVPITKSLYEEYMEAGLIIPATNPDWRPTNNPGKVIGNKTSTQVLMELRAEERY